MIEYLQILGQEIYKVIFFNCAYSRISGHDRLVR